MWTLCFICGNPSARTGLNVTAAHIACSGGARRRLENTDIRCTGQHEMQERDQSTHQCLPNAFTASGNASFGSAGKRFLSDAGFASG